MEKATEQIGLRVSKTLKTRIEAQAEKERRKVSNLIIKVVEDYLDEQDRKEEIK